MTNSASGDPFAKFPASFPVGFFARSDETPDDQFYASERLVTHIDDDAITSVGAVYTELGVSGSVLDLMSSWISHLEDRPDRLVALGMNSAELAANPMAHETLVHDLNRTPHLPFPDRSFDAVICTVSVDYLTRPVEVFAAVGRVLVPGGVFACTFSNRCFPTKAIQGWLANDDLGRCELVADYFRLAECFDAPQGSKVDTAGRDPLFAVWAHRSAES